MSENIHRRDVLASISGGTLLTLSSGAEALETDVAVQLIEASMVFDLPDANYISDRPHGNPIYTVDTERNVVAVYPTRSNEGNRILSGGRVVGTQSVVDPPTRIGPAQETYVVTDTLGYRRPTEIVYTDAVPAVANPQIAVAGESAVVDTGSDQLTVAPDESIELERSEIELTVYERSRSESRATVEGVPAHRTGNSVEMSERTVTATPRVRVKNHGTLPVTRIVDE